MQVLAEERITGLEDADRAWGLPPRRPRLCAGQVHAWRGRLERDEGDLRRDESVLSADELIRAGRFVRTADRDRFIAARAFLRRVLAAYAGVPPQSLRFRYGPQGKPELSGVGTGVGFNVAHSGDWVLCVVAPARHVGVDIERWHSAIAPADLDGALTPAEREVLTKSGGRDSKPDMLKLWTRKEAVVKAIGVGLSQPLDRLEVGFDQDVIRTPAHPVGWWRLWHVSPAPGYMGSVAVEDGAWRLLLWNGPPAEGGATHGERVSSNTTFPFRTRGRAVRPFGTDLHG